MKIVLAGSDGYIGRELYRKLVEKHDVFCLDNLWRRKFMEKYNLISAIPVGKPNVDFQIDISKDYRSLRDIIKKENPDVIVNLAQNPMPVYSMLGPMEAKEVQNNNNNGMLNLLFAVKTTNPKIPIITLGTLGEMGAPKIPVKDSGWIEIEYRGKKDIFPTPRIPYGSLYHVSKAQASLNNIFAAKIWDIKVIDLMQGPVEGGREDDFLYFSHIDGTVVNRLMCQAIIGEILRYGTEKNKFPFISLEDSVRAIITAMKYAVEEMDENYLAPNQFDSRSVLSIEEVIKTVLDVASDLDLNVTERIVESPRIEPPREFYDPETTELPRMGFKPSKTIKEEIRDTMELLLKYKDRILKHKQDIYPKKVLGWTK